MDTNNRHYRSHPPRDNMFATLGKEMMKDVIFGKANQEYIARPPGLQGYQNQPYGYQYGNYGNYGNSFYRNSYYRNGYQNSEYQEFKKWKEEKSQMEANKKAEEMERIRKDQEERELRQAERMNRLMDLMERRMENPKEKTTENQKSEIEEVTTQIRMRAENFERTLENLIFETREKLERTHAELTKKAKPTPKKRKPQVESDSEDDVVEICDEENDENKEPNKKTKKVSKLQKQLKVQNKKFNSPAKPRRSQTPKSKSKTVEEDADSAIAELFDEEKEPNSEEEKLQSYKKAKRVEGPKN